MSQAIIMWIVVVCLTQPNGGVEVNSNTLDFFKTSQTKTKYGGVIFYDIRRLYLNLCNQSVEEYRLTSNPDDKLDTYIAAFPKDYNPNNYLNSFLCERNEAYYFICQRMLKTYKPQKGQTWYKFQLGNTSCNLDGIRILSGVNQVLENKHFIDVPLDSVFFSERLAVESQGKKESCSCCDPNSGQLASASMSPTTVLSTSRFPTTLPSTKASPVFTKSLPNNITSKLTGFNLFKTITTSPTTSLPIIPSHSSYLTQQMTYSTTFNTENTRERSSSLSIDSKSSKNSRMEHIYCHADIPIYIHVIMGTLSFATVSLLVLTVCLCLKLRKHNQSENGLFKEQDGKVVEGAALNEYTNMLEQCNK